MRILFTFLLLLNFFYAHSQCDPFFGKVVINEFMPANSGTATDNFGEYDDWVEIHNTTDEAIDIGGWFLSDSRADRTKYRFPNMEIDANEYLIIWCDGQPEQGSFHTNFNLSNDGEKLGLYNGDTTSVDFFRYGPGVSNISWGRYPNGSGPIQQLVPTFDAENIMSAQPGLVINEFMATNESTATDQYGGFEDWIEIYNNSNVAINLEGYFLSDKIGDPTQFVFPDTVIEPDSYIIVWCDQGLFEPGLHTFFKLGADGDDILFSDSDTLTIDYLRYKMQLPDISEARYGNGTGSFACPPSTFESSNGFPNSLFERQKEEELTVWPNPTSGKFSLRNDENRKMKVQIFNPIGTLLKEVMIDPGVSTFSIEEFSSGIYIIKTEKGNNRLIKQ